MNLYAVWQINTYTVEFNANGGSGSVESESYQYNEEKALNINSFTRVGYIFKEWNTSSDGSGIKYADQSVVKNLTENNDQTITLYAQWTPITYEVKFDANGAEGSLVNESFTYDEEKALSWLSNGAQPTDTVRDLLSKEGIMKKFHESKMKKGK